MRRSVALVAPILGAAVAGLLTPRGYNWLPADAIFEATILVLFVTSGGRLRKSLLWLVAGAAIYLIASAAVAFTLGAKPHPLDFALAFKPFAYVILLAPLVGRGFLDRSTLRTLLWALLIIFLLKYTYSLALGFSSRPGVFTENNFELIFLLFLGLAVLKTAGAGESLATTTALIVVFALSRSISGAAALAFGLGIFSLRRALTLRTILLLLLAAVSLVLVATILAIRYGSIDPETVDRVRFLQVFLAETGSWSANNWLYGQRPFGPLSHQACTSLSYYQSLFSYGSPSACYSVILHAFMLRVVIDHGVLGLIFLLGAVGAFLRRSRYRWNEVLAVLGVLILTGLSVSSLSNPYAALGLAVLIARGVPSGTVIMKDTPHVASGRLRECREH